MTADPKWLAAMWAIHDMSIYGVSRLATFRKLVAIGFTRREAAELIREAMYEP